MKLIISILCLAALGGIALILAPSASSGAPLRIEILLPLLVVAVIIGGWWLATRRRERRKLEEMRDSALW